MWKILYSIVLGWSVFGFTSIGHELYHLDKLNIIQKLIAFLYLDLWSVNKTTWVLRHNKWHHYNVYEEGEDEHMINGSLIKNYVHTITTLVKTYDLLQFSVTNYLLILFRILFFSQITWYCIFITYTIIILCVTHFTFITHSAPVICECNNSCVKQLNRSVDIFPNSYLTLLIMGGFNLHSSHHCYPKCTRNELQIVHNKLRDKYPDNLKVIETFHEFYNLYKYRDRQFENMNEWARHIKDDCK